MTGVDEIIADIVAHETMTGAARRLLEVQAIGVLAAMGHLGATVAEIADDLGSAEITVEVLLTNLEYEGTVRKIPARRRGGTVYVLGG